MVLRLLTYLFFGLPVLAGRLVVDIFFLIWDDFKLTPIKQQQQFEGCSLHGEVVQLIMRILEEKINHKNIYESCPTREILIELRSQMGIKLTYNDICSMTYTFANKRPPLQMLLSAADKSSPKLEQFAMAKEYLL